jgi:hypothetical protein
MILIAALLLGGGQDADRVEATLSDYHRLTRVETTCRDRTGEEIVVCARRDADRYRVPLPSGPSFRDAEPRTARLLDTHAPACGQGAFTVGCGKVGASVTRTFGPGTNSGDVRVETDREKTP